MIDHDYTVINDHPERNGNACQRVQMDFDFQYIIEDTGNYQVRDNTDQDE